MTTCSLGLKALRVDQLKAAFAFGKDYFLRTSRVDERWSGSGVVICGGGRYLQWALNNVRNCRRWWQGPIQVWCLNEREIPQNRMFEELGVQVVNAQNVLPQAPMRKWGAWQMKMWAVLNSPFDRVMFLDADCLATREGIGLLEQDLDVFMTDCKRCHQSDLPFFSATLQPPRFLKPPQQEFETGAFVVNKSRCHVAIRLAVWLSEHSDSWWALGHGDKLTTEIAFRALRVPVKLGTGVWKEWGIEHSVDGKWVFAHALGVKRGKAQMPVIT